MLPTTSIVSTNESSVPVAARAETLGNRKYFPEMDALRSFAVALTLVAHLFPAVGWMLVPYSWYGVDIFFTISGFLITLTLLRSRDGGLSKSKEVRHFFIRRFLRLFPIYYLFLLFFFLAWKFGNLHMWRPEYGPYFFGYAANFYFYQHTLGAAPGYSHLWSLSIEEQFYLVWPWLILFIRVQRLLPVIIFFVVFGVAAHGLGGRLGDVRLLPIGNFHTLGIGALLAWLHYFKADSAIYKGLVLFRSSGAAASLIWLLLMLFYVTDTHPLLEIVRQLALMTTTFFLVLLSIHGWPKPFQLITRSSVLQYFGQISYGIYLYHMPIPILLGIFMTKMGVLISSPMLHLTILVAITVLVSAVSFRFIEKPFLKLKALFQ